MLLSLCVTLPIHITWPSHPFSPTSFCSHHPLNPTTTTPNTSPPYHQNLHLFTPMVNPTTTCFSNLPSFFFFFPFKKKILKYDNKLPPKTRSRVKRGSYQYFKDKFQFVFFILNLSFSKISMISRFYFTKNSSFQTRNLW